MVALAYSRGAGVAATAGLAHHDVADVVLLDGDAIAFGGNHRWLTSPLIYPLLHGLYRLATGSDWIVARILRNVWGPNAPHPTTQPTRSSKAHFASWGPQPRSHQLSACGGQ